LHTEHTFNASLENVERRRLVNILTWWWWELAAAIFSIVCLGAMVAVLAAIDNKPSSDWKIFSVDLTPNALIALLAILSKASLLAPTTEAISQLKWLHFLSQDRRLGDLQLFDRASRGLAGSACLLWSLNLKVDSQKNQAL
jgi:hypothetical protein